MTGAAMGADTFFIVNIETTDGGSSWDMTIYNSAGTQLATANHSTRVPVTSTKLGIAVHTTTLTTAVRQQRSSGARICIIRGL